MRHLHKLKHLHKKVRSHHVISGLAVAGIAVVAMNFTRPPLFNSLDRFVLFVSDKIQLAQDVQVSSGDLGSNKEIDIDKNAIINGNLFAGTITIDKNTQVNGNVAANRLTLKKSSTIFGSTSSSISLPVANLPQVPAFQIGTQDFTFRGATSTLIAGSYRTITLIPSSTLTLLGGTYRLRALDLKDNATLIVNAPTTLNIQFKLKGKDNVSILPGRGMKPDDLKINYLGIKPKNDKNTEDDDGEVASLLDQQEKKDLKDGKIGRPVLFGKNSFLNFKLLAPKSNVHFKDTTTLRGQVLARGINIGKEAIVSRKEVLIQESDFSKIVQDQQGLKFVGNEIIVLFQNGATLVDAQQVANLVNGKITGFTSKPVIYKIQVLTTTIAALNNNIQIIQNSHNPLIIHVAPNIILNLIQ